MQTNGIFGLASQQANWLATRQQTIAENISHSNIPGYAAKDVEPFKALIERGGPELAKTNPKHVSSIRSHGNIKRVETVNAPGEQAGHMNIETELMKSTQVRSEIELNTAIVKAFHRMILTVSKA